MANLLEGIKDFFIGLLEYIFAHIFILLFLIPFVLLAFIITELLESPWWLNRELTALESGFVGVLPFIAFLFIAWRFSKPKFKF